jgi:hypothetical protein
MSSASIRILSLFKSRLNRVIAAPVAKVLAERETSMPPASPKTKKEGD